MIVLLERQESFKASSLIRRRVVLTIGIGVLVGLVVGVALSKSERFPFFVGGVFGLLMGAVVGFMVAMAVTVNAPTPYRLEEVGSYNLASLRSVDGVSGDFFLGSGSVGSDLYYFYFVDQGDQGLVASKVNATGGWLTVRVHEVDGQTGGVLKTYKWVPDRSSPVVWFGVAVEGPVSVYDFYVPA